MLLLKGAVTYKWICNSPCPLLLINFLQSLCVPLTDRKNTYLKAPPCSALCESGEKDWDPVPQTPFKALWESVQLCAWDKPHSYRLHVCAEKSLPISLGFLKAACLQEQHIRGALRQTLSPGRYGGDEGRKSRTTSQFLSASFSRKDTEGCVRRLCQTFERTLVSTVIWVIV